MTGRACTALAAVLTACLAAPTRAAPPDTPTQLVATMNTLWGRHAGMRANHAKGIAAAGSFTPTPEAASLSTASVFAPGARPVIVRFSDSTGLPDIPDGSPGATPHGMSVKFTLPGGGTMDLVTNSLAYFPAATPQDFLALLDAIAASPQGAGAPSPAQKYFAAHPVAEAAFATAHTPSSFARDTYNGIDAFIFTNAAGKRQPFRFRLVPLAGNDFLTPAQAAARKPNFLIDELTARLARGPVRFRLVAQLASPGDPIADPTRPWPASDRLADLGTITITQVLPDNAAAQRKLLFVPGNVPPGITPSPDPLIPARNQAYGISYAHRLAN